MDLREKLKAGMVIPAHPLALNAQRQLDERRQRALTRYYLEAGAGGVAVGVHTTQFAIRAIGLFEPVLRIAMEELNGRNRVAIAGVCGDTKQAVREAALAVECGYDAGLLSLAALKDASPAEMVLHARKVAEVIPIMGFYLQPAVGGRVLPYAFWREFADIENVVAIKMAPFNRYQTLDVIRAVADSGRASDIALYTGNDDSIIVDLLTQFQISGQKLRIVGGLLGHWAVWTRRAVEIFNDLTLSGETLTMASQLTDANAAFFDSANHFHGCIAGIHEVLRRQGLLEGRWCLDPSEDVSPGQLEEIDRVYAEYPHLNDDEFVRQNLNEWLS